MAVITHVAEVTRDSVHTIGKFLNESKKYFAGFFEARKPKEPRAAAEL
jgi:hypothetical protein